MFKYNQDYERRDDIIFGAACPPEEEWAGGIRRFEIAPSVMEKLIDEGFVDITDRHNDSPSIEDYMQFFRFVAKPELWKIIGYAVSHERDDYRVSVDGCETESNLNISDLTAFATLFRFADEFELTPYNVRCWFD